MNYRSLAAGTVALALPLSAAFAGDDLTAPINRLGLQLARQQAAQSAGENWALSPYSIESGLALAYAGAAGTTRSELVQVLGLASNSETVAANFAALRKSYADRADRSGLGWQSGNRLFGQTGYAFFPAFLSAMQKDYDSPFQALDFRHSGPAASASINRWVSEQTHGKIHDPLAPGSVGAQTRLVLVNAVYLKAKWAEPFEQSQTKPRPFFSLHDAATTVPTMRRTLRANYWKKADYTAVSIPYAEGSDLQLLILLPTRRDGLADMIAKLSAETLRRFAPKAEVSKTLVSLYLPKFRLEGLTLALGSRLRALGLRSAFNEPKGSADFSRIAPRAPDDYLYLSEVYHQAFVEVDEAGTEAAAATETVLLSDFAVRADPVEPIVVRVDHPFFFALQDRLSGLCLFMGGLSDPGQAGN